MKNKIKIFNILFILGLISIIYFSLKEKQKKIQGEELRLEYSDMNFNSNLSGIVIDIKKAQSSYNKGAIFIELDSGSKFIVSVATKNLKYDPPYITDFIQIRDSVIKLRESEFITIYRNDKRYLFKLNKTIK